MADTYSQIYIHIVFAVKGRNNLISKNWKDELYKYITGIITNEGQKLLAINGMADHIHIFIGLKPTATLSNIVRDIKANSSKFINDKKWIAGKFEWQQGFGAFSYSYSQLPNVISYIQNQEEHHKTKTFREEYIEFLKLYNVDFKNEFIFENV
ncbi:IS200/IS605 family transposase [Flavobacterium sp. NRK1]|uniref:IS200/IS605 family transposase n=1 Tax=Flavobacterium sp. NRK1 TaxID=2954929 RepID=UPI0020938801|nr:IS200/IS605 family transposase [Flavobacterium sp. NRK1]MCO6147716.1 IS200/IS605 family transposase [Flavobacterium sp. NRK1]